MFNLLKDKLKNAISSFTKKVEEEGEISISNEIKEEAADKKGIFGKFIGKFSRKDVVEDINNKEVIEKTQEDDQNVSKEVMKSDETLKIHKDDKNQDHIDESKEKKILEKIDPGYNEDKLSKNNNRLHKREESESSIVISKESEIAEEKKGFLSRIKEKIVTTKINGSQFDAMFWDLETILLENNVAVEVIEKIKDDLKNELVEKPIPRGRVEKQISDSLKKSIDDLFVERLDILQKIDDKKPFVICFVGINGSGKTTTIAKIAHLLKNNKKSIVIAAGDTFRAAAISQLQEHADKLAVKLIKHDYGADPAAVAFDAIAHAKARNIDVVLIDTAGRMHSNINLQDEMKKIIRVAKPDLKIFVGESITGNDCVEQAKQFNNAIGIDAIILAKADIDEKGGAAISISYVTKKPIIFFGTGQEYADLKVFDHEFLNKSLGLA